MALGTPTIRRVRPSVFSLGASLILSFLAAVTIVLYGGQLLLFVLPFALGTLAFVFFIRVRSVRSQAPPPEGEGRTKLVDARQALVQGVALLVGGAAVIFGPFVLVAYLPGPDVIASVLGLVTGLALSQPAFYAWVSTLEKRTGSEIYSVTGLTEMNGKQVLVKTIELRRESPVPKSA